MPHPPRDRYVTQEGNQWRDGIDVATALQQVERIARSPREHRDFGRPQNRRRDCRTLGFAFKQSEIAMIRGFADEPRGKCAMYFSVVYI